MKICHITSIHSRFDSRIFFKQCLSLAEDKNDVFFLVNDSFNDEIINGVNILSIRTPYKSYIHRFISPTIKKKYLDLSLKINADIYQIHDPELIFLAIDLKKKGKKIVYDIHEDYPKEILLKKWIPFFIRPLVSYFFELIENRFSSKFNGLVTVVPKLYDRFIKINSNTIIVSNFPKIDDIQSNLNYSVNYPLVYVGGLTIKRGIHQMIIIAKKIKKKLTLIGKFESKKLQIIAKKNSNYVNYLGQLGKFQVQEILNKSSIGLVILHKTPNIINGYPTKLFEYMAAGIPVIASNYPIFKSFVEQNKCGFCVNPYDINEISTKIMYLVNHPNISKKMGLNGQKLIKNKYNWEFEYSKLKNLYINIHNF
jgi:glycosyltransferase involved in cell wall biosynthesis